jgi:hypothetical protein
MDQLPIPELKSWLSIVFDGPVVEAVNVDPLPRHTVPVAAGLKDITEGAPFTVIG